MLHLMYPETSLLLQLCFIYLIYLFRVGLATTKTRDVVILHWQECDEELYEFCVSPLSWKINDSSDFVYLGASLNFTLSALWQTKEKV